MSTNGDVFHRFHFLISLCLLVAGLATVQAETPMPFQPGVAEWRLVPESSVLRIGDDPSWLTSEIDDNWRSLTDDAFDSEHGIVWIRHRILLNRPSPMVGYKELTLSMHASYEIYWDGQLIGRSGKVGASRESEEPGPIYNSFLLSPAQYSNGEHQLALRASSQYRGNLDFSRTFWVADYSASNRYAALSSLLPALFLPVFLVIGVYYLALYWTSRRTTSHLLFALACLSLMTYGVSIQWPHMVGFSYDWNVRIDTAESLALIFFTVTLPAFFISRYAIGKRYYAVLGLAFVAVVSHAVGTGSGQYLPLFALAMSLLATGLAYRQGHRAVLGELISLAVCLLAAGWWLGDTENMLVYFPLLILALLISQALQMQRQKRSLEQARLTQSRLECELLRRSLQPHFLMNTLANLLEGVETDVERTSEFIADLGEEFRMLADMAERQLVPLSEELGLCRTHLSIMSFRMRSELRLECTGANDDLAIPPATLHTLIENALTHNDYADQSVQFLLEVSQQQSTTTLRMYTPLGAQGQPDESPSAGTGIGLKYVRSRLQQSFPDRWELASHTTRTHWVTTISVRNMGEFSDQAGPAAMAVS